MMFSLRKVYSNFYIECYTCHNHLRVISSHGHAKIYLKDDSRLDPKLVFIQTAGVINQIWQAWNHFWRYYWLTHFYGGFGYNSTIAGNTLGITGLTSLRIQEEEALFIILQAAGFDMRKYRNGSVLFFQEPTWGDIKIIEKLSLKFNNPGGRILSALSVFGDSAIHLQLVRNASIHISKGSQLDLKNRLIPSYTIARFKYPTDIAYSRPIGSTKVGILSWIDELTAFLQLL